MWTTRLLLLGLVRWLQPVHGYEVHRELTSWGVADWAGVKRGSIYYGLKKLTQEGDLSIDSIEQVDSRPARTSYRLTEQGEAAFFSLLRDKLWGASAATDDFWIAWSFVPVLPHREAAAMLRNRAGLLRDRDQEISNTLRRRATDPTADDYLPTHIHASLSMWAEQNRIDITWCEDTARRIEAGELYDETLDRTTTENAERWKAHIRKMTDDHRP